MREDIRPGLRILGYRGRVSIAFEVAASTVTIVGVFYGGRDYPTDLRPTDVDS
jgi:toxin ParE1/3/4